MPRRRIVVALLFTAAGITPMAALGAAWGEQQQGWASETTVTVTGRVAATFSTPATPPALVAAPAAPGTATPAAAIPQPVEPAAAATTEPTSPPADDTEPTGRPSQTRSADPEPTETATPSAPTEGSN